MAIQALRGNNRRARNIRTTITSDVGNKTNDINASALMVAMFRDHGL